MKTIKYQRTIKEDMKALDNIASAYHNCSDNFKSMWKQKWYRMCGVIAQRVYTEDNPTRKVED